jgi:hypothetical protein
MKGGYGFMADNATAQERSAATWALLKGTEITVESPSSSWQGYRWQMLAALWPERADSPVFLRLLANDKEGGNDHAGLYPDPR